MTKYTGRKVFLPVIITVCAGENEGRTAIGALLTQIQPARDVTPVFGCPLFGKGTEREGEFCDVSGRN